MPVRIQCVRSFLTLASSQLQSRHSLTLVHEYSESGSEYISNLEILAGIYRFSTVCKGSAFKDETKAF